MSFRWQFAARCVALFAIALATSGLAHAVSTFGPVKRVDVDPTSTPIYWIGNFYVTRTAPGGFAAAWEENTKSDNPIVYERIPFRVYNNAFAPVAVPKPANLTGRSAPNLARLVPLGANNAYLVYYGTRTTVGNPDHPTLRDAFGQTIALATGTATGARQLLNSTGNWDTLIALAAGLSGGRPSQRGTSQMRLLRCLVVSSTMQAFHRRPFLISPVAQVPARVARSSPDCFRSEPDSSPPICAIPASAETTGSTAMSSTPTASLSAPRSSSPQTRRIPSSGRCRTTASQFSPFSRSPTRRTILSWWCSSTTRTGRRSAWPKRS